MFTIGHATKDGGAEMAICRRRRRTLREIERHLAASDPRLHDSFLSFAAGTRGCTIPRAERILPWPLRALTRLWRGRSMRERARDWRAENRIDP